MEIRPPPLKPHPYTVLESCTGTFSVVGPQLPLHSTMYQYSNKAYAEAAAYNMNFGYNVAVGNIVLLDRVNFTTTVEIMHNDDPVEQEVYVVADKYKTKNKATYNYSVTAYTQDGEVVDELEDSEMQELLDQVQTQFKEQTGKTSVAYNIIQDNSDESQRAN